MSEPIAPYHERLPELERELTRSRQPGHAGARRLGARHDRGASTARQPYEEVRQRVFKILDEQRGKDYRAGDLLCLDRPRGLRLLFMLDRKRRRNVPLSIGDLRTARGRLVASLAPNMARAAFPYIKTPPRLEVGHGLAVHNPLLHTERVIERALDGGADPGRHTSARPRSCRCSSGCRTSCCASAW